VIRWLTGRAPLGLLARCAHRNPCCFIGRGLLLGRFSQDRVEAAAGARGRIFIAPIVGDGIGLSFQRFYVAPLGAEFFGHVLLKDAIPTGLCERHPQGGSFPRSEPNPRGTDSLESHHARKPIRPG
jgi:hypothetical protein